MQSYNRKSTPAVKDGKVLKKNRHALTPSYWNTPQRVPVIDKERPGQGYKHYLRKKHIIDFISILPDWEEISKGLDAVVLSRKSRSADGWYDFGVIGICAWERELWQPTDLAYFEDHQSVFSRLGVISEPNKGYVLCKFTDAQVRAFQLLHIFLHELGHHHDLMTTKSRVQSSRGENYAEHYALQYEKMIWERYLETFGLE